MTLIGPGPVVRAEADGADKFAAFDVALAKLMERIRRAKDRRKVHRGHGDRMTSLRKASADGFASRRRRAGRRGLDDLGGDRRPAAGDAADGRGAGRRVRTPTRTTARSSSARRSSRPCR